MYKQVFKKVVVFIITWQARLVLAKYKPRIIAVTGSVGKTSTKDAIYAVLSAREFVRKSEKSFNSDIGVPLTILGRPNAWNNPLGWLSNIGIGFLLLVTKHRYPRWLVLEVGADRPGDIRKIATWLKPDVVVVTRLANVPVHVEYFSSVEDVFKEKSELVKALKPNGVAVLSGDDETVLSFKNLARTHAYTFGFSKGSDVLGEKVKVIYEGRKYKHPVGISFHISYKEESVEIGVHDTLGRQNLFAILAAAAVGVSLDFRLGEIGEAFKNYLTPPGRMKIVPGIKETTIIDDSYNSSPVAVREALDALTSLSVKGRKIAVLGDMLELGHYSIQEHKDIGAYAATRADFLVAVGPRARDFIDGAMKSGMPVARILQFDDARAATTALPNFVIENDVVLIKGSQGIRMERIVEILMLHPEDKAQLLVRQEEEWLRR